MSIPHCFALSSALRFVLPPAALPPPPFFLCFFKASATVNPGAPDRIKVSSSSSSSSSLMSRMTCCLTTRLAGGSFFAPGLAVEDTCDEAESSFNFVISNKLSDCAGDTGGEPDVIGCACARTGAGTGFAATAGGARYVVGDGIGELRDLSDCMSRFRSRSISSFFFCCSLTNDDLETSSFPRFGTVRDSLAAEIVSMSSTRSRSRRILSSIYMKKKYAQPHVLMTVDKSSCMRHSPFFRPLSLCHPLGSYHRVSPHYRLRQHLSSFLSQQAR